MKVIQKKISELKRYKNNSRVHTKQQIEQIAASINEFGFNNPLLINADNRVIAGHGRLEAAELLDMDKLPCVVIEGLTKEQERAYIIADNKIAMNASWDIDMLKIEMSDISEFMDIALTGFTEMEFSSLFGESVTAIEAWEDMPEFTQKSTEAFKRMIVHFATQEHVNKFAELVKQSITEKTKYIWFPEIIIEKASQKKYQ
tara:strand:- start:153 stop:755 length:603 start_codon:yes stop_codon:yes gene_type:complete